VVAGQRNRFQPKLGTIFVAVNMNVGRLIPFMVEEVYTIWAVSMVSGWPAAWATAARTSMGTLFLLVLNPCDGCHSIAIGIRLVF
jgi:hypothetical protein